MKTFYQRYSLPQLVFLIILTGMFIIYLHDLSIDNYRKFKDSKIMKEEDLKHKAQSFVSQQGEKPGEYLLRKRKLEKINFLISMIDNGAMLQEEYEKLSQTDVTENTTDAVPVTDGILEASSVTREVELFDI